MFFLESENKTTQEDNNEQKVDWVKYAGIAIVAWLTIIGFIFVLARRWIKKFRGLLDGFRKRKEQMMAEMMPRCLRMVLPKVEKEKRANYVSSLVKNLIDVGSEDMSEKEKKKLAEKISGNN